MSYPTVFKGDPGVKIIVNTVANVAAASVRKIRFLKPSGVSGAWDAVLESPTSLSRTTLTTDFTETGIWWLQAYVELSGTQKLHGLLGAILCEEPIPPPTS